MLVDGPAASARQICAILDGQQGPPRDIVVLNAAAAIWTTDPSQPLHECAQRAEAAIDQGAARDLLARLVELSNL
jgi:anthranilate phosphoribosyltransferase